LDRERLLDVQHALEPHRNRLRVNALEILEPLPEVSVLSVQR
jgi:hypothetical protein